jgi:hypothetical protein
MTVSSAINRVTFTGDDVTTSFDTTPVKFFATSDLLVYVTVTATGATTLKTEGTHYTVSGGDAASGAVGTVNLAGGSSPHGALLTGTKLVVIRELPLLQGADFVQNDASNAEVAEAAVDKLVMNVQRLDDLLSRSLVVSDGDVSGADFTVPTPAASKLLGWASNGLSLVNYALTDLNITAVPAYALAIITAANEDAFFQKMIDGMTAETAPAVGDLIALSDISLAPDSGRKMTLENMLKVVNGLTEDTAPDVDADFQLTYDASAGAAKKVLARNWLNLPFPPEYISGLTLSNNATDATNDIDIAAGKARDSGNAANMVLAATLVKRMDASWAVGTNQGGLDGTESVAGTPDNDTWYYVWLIRRSDTGVVDALFSESSSAPTMPTNYDQKRLIGAVRRGTATNMAFYQDGDWFRWQADVTVLNAGAAAASTAITITPAVPPIAKSFQFDVLVNASSGGAGQQDLTVVFRIATGVDYLSRSLRVSSVLQFIQAHGGYEVPNTGVFEYRRTIGGATTTGTVTVAVLGFKLAR